MASKGKDGKEYVRCGVGYYIKSSRGYDNISMYLFKGDTKVQGYLCQNRYKSHPKEPDWNLLIERSNADKLGLHYVKPEPHPESSEVRAEGRKEKRYDLPEDVIKELGL